MQPTVRWLQNTYGEDVAFQIVDANSPKGAAWLTQLRLPGHPSYVLFDADNQEVFRTFGVVEQAVLEDQIRMLLR